MATVDQPIKFTTPLSWPINATAKQLANHNLRARDKVITTSWA